MRIAKGSQYMILSSLFFTFIGLGVKLLAPLSNLEINFFKSLVACSITLPVLIYYQVPLKGNNIRLLLLRGMSGGMGIIFFL